MKELNFRRATRDDLAKIIELLADDDLGKLRERIIDKPDQCYDEAFKRIDKDPNQYLMVVTFDAKIVGTCLLTLMPSLTYRGSMQLLIDAVRIAKEYRGQKIGEKMMRQALQFAKDNQAKIVQLTTNKKRSRAKTFYERLGFVATHEGMKFQMLDE